MVVAGTASLLPGCGIGVVVRDGDPGGGVTEVLVPPGLVEGGGELGEGEGFLVAHCGGGKTHSLELWEGSVLGTVVLTVVVGK